MPEGLLPLLTAVFSIVVIDLVLSGDNAVVIGMAAHQLPPKQQRQAILFGAVGAVGLRIVFTALAAVLLGIPALQAIGGVVLIWIALKLLRQEESSHNVKEGTSLFEAVKTIVLADVVMSLDNILAVGGAAHGNVGLLLFGLALSMPIILFGSSLVARLMDRVPWLIYLGAAVLVYTGMEMTLADPLISPHVPHNRPLEIGLSLVVTAGIVGLGHWLNRRQTVRAQASAHALAEPIAADD